MTGLWAIVAPPALYVVLGSSPYLSTGPESTTALMTVAAVAPLAGGEPARHAVLASALAGLVGLRGVAAMTLWNLRVLAGWLPAEGAELIHVLAAWFEIVNIDEHLRSFTADPADTGAPPFRLGSLATASPRPRHGLATASPRPRHGLATASPRPRHGLAAAFEDHLAGGTADCARCLSVERPRSTAGARDRRRNRRAYSEAQETEALRRPVVAELCWLIRLRSAHPAFQGAFSLGPVSPGELRMAWRAESAQVELRNHGESNPCVAVINAVEGQDAIPAPRWRMWSAVVADVSLRWRRLVARCRT